MIILLICRLSRRGILITLLLILALDILIKDRNSNSGIINCLLPVKSGKSSGLVLWFNYQLPLRLEIIRNKRWRYFNIPVITGSKIKSDSHLLYGIQRKNNEFIVIKELLFVKLRVEWWDELALVSWQVYNRIDLPDLFPLISFLSSFPFLIIKKPRLNWL